MEEDFDLPKPVTFNWKKVGLYALPAALIVGVLVSKLGTKKTQSEKDYVSATVAFTKWDQILDENGPELTQLEKIVKKHPELQAQYDAPVGQNLLAAIAPNEATPFIERSLNRTKNLYYEDYSKDSLKISQGKYDEALQGALTLKEKMLSDSQYWEKLEDNSALFAFNLMRIAILSQQTGNKEEELSAWQEIKSYAGMSQNDPQGEKVGHAGFKQLFSHFSVQETTLLDYIKAREEDLRKP